MRRRERDALQGALERHMAGEATPGFTFYSCCASCSATSARWPEQGLIARGSPGVGRMLEPVHVVRNNVECEVCGSYDVELHAERVHLDLSGTLETAPRHWSVLPA